MGRKKSSDCSFCPGSAPGPLCWDSLSLGCVTAGASIEGCFLRLCARPWDCRAAKEGGLAKHVHVHSFARLFSPRWVSLVAESTGILSGQAVSQHCLARSAWPPATPLHPGHTRAPGLPLLCGSFSFCLWPLGRQGRACPVYFLCGDAQSWLGFGNAQAGHLLRQCVCLGGLSAAFPYAGVGSCPKEPIQGRGDHGVLG